jgi:hypothetical protein
MKKASSVKRHLPKKRKKGGSKQPPEMDAMLEKFITKLD